MNFKRLSIATLQALSLGLMPAAALAADETDTVKFIATVPGACTYAYTKGKGETVTMTYNASANTLIGVSGGMTVNCNFVASATLGKVTMVKEPAGVTTSAAATLNSGETTIATSSKSSASNATSIANTAGVAKALSVKLDIGDATASGSYEYTVLLTILNS
ncbi:hypothetical protein N9T98_01385 [bacterium]|nr:hypothetical protein [bacterium]